MNQGTTIAIVAVVGVLVVVGAVYFIQRQQRPAPLTPEQQIAAGIGSLVGGIVGAATASDSD